MQAKSAKATAVSKVYRVRILAPDSATKWLLTEDLAVEVEEMGEKKTRKHRAAERPPAKSSRAA